MKLFLQATTNKLHTQKNCMVTRRTRYSHFEIEVESASATVGTATSSTGDRVEVDISTASKCLKCWH